MTVEDRKLHVFFLPYFTPSHMIPMVGAARLFAARGVRVTIATTPCNVPLFQTSIDSDIASGLQISVHTLKFPSTEVDLPEGIENFSAITSPEMATKVFNGIALLQQPTEELIRDISPDCIFSDMFFPWTVDLANELKIPRILFYPTCFFYQCVFHSLKFYAPYKRVESNTENFSVPGLPDKIERKKSQLEDYVMTKTWYGEIVREIIESAAQSYGVVFDTFYEIEPAYVDHYRMVKGGKIWHIGPIFHFSNRNKAKTSGNSISEKHSCLSWLDTQRPNSVLYVCFGSLVRFPDAQLTGIALALEASNHPFVWVVRKRGKSQENEEMWMPEGFEERIVEGNKGMIIRGWAPQVMILDHPAIGGFMTHCGWNSVQEAVIAGVPLITWPLFAEQFYNEKLIELLRIGIQIGSDVWNNGFEITGPLVRKDKIEKAVISLMGGSEEAEQIRRRAKEIAESAKRAVEEVGSSYVNLTALIEEIKGCALEKTKNG